MLVERDRRVGRVARFGILVVVLVVLVRGGGVGGFDGRRRRRLERDRVLRVG